MLLHFSGAVKSRSLSVDWALWWDFDIGFFGWETSGGCMYIMAQNLRQLANFYGKCLHASWFNHHKYLGLVTTSVLDTAFRILWNPCSNPLFQSQWQSEWDLKQYVSFPCSMHTFLRARMLELWLICVKIGNSNSVKWVVNWPSTMVPIAHSWTPFLRRK